VILILVLLTQLVAGDGWGREHSADLFDPALRVRSALSLVRVEARREGGKVSVGTGVVIAPNMVETACHVVRDAASITMVHGGRAWSVSGQYVDPAHDLCVFLVPYLEAKPADFRPAAELEIGEPVTAVGYSGGFGLRWQVGQVVRLHHYEGSVVIQSSAPFTSGASGGSLLDAQGRVVGFLNFRMRGPGPQFFALPAEWAQTHALVEKDFLPIDTRFIAQPFWATDPSAAPFFILANSLEAEGRGEELRELCGRWRVAEPDSAEPAFVEAGLEERDGRLEAALAALDQALLQDPTHVLARRARVRLRMAASDLGGAQEDYAVLAQSHPELAREAADENPALSR
jgi:serine protease Do